MQESSGHRSWKRYDSCSVVQHLNSSRNGSRAGLATWSGLHGPLYFRALFRRLHDLVDNTVIVIIINGFYNSLPINIGKARNEITLKDGNCDAFQLGAARHRDSRSSL